MVATTETIDLQNNSLLPAELITQLLQQEKEAKRTKRNYSFEQLLGSWQLTFITGTKKAQKKAGKALGKGRYLPRWVTIAIAYSASPDNETTSEWQKGTVINTVKFGLVTLAVSGCIKFQEQKRLLAFDFTHLNIKCGGAQLYDGDMRGGDDAAAKFYDTPIGKLPFFSYFYVSDEAIAARGKGGGIALWTKITA